MGQEEEPGRATRAICDHSAVFEAWFHVNFQKLTADLMRIGAGYDEAQDAAAVAAEDLYRRWQEVNYPSAYARKAALHSLIRNRQHRQREHELMLKGCVHQDQHEEPGLTAWEDMEWVCGLLRSLPPAQRQVISLIHDEFTPAEAAQLLGRTPEAVRTALHDARRRLRADLNFMRSLEGMSGKAAR